MTCLLVHGNPETSVIWDPLVDALAKRGVDDVVRLSPPGFGAPLPDDFDTSADGYLGWLVGELEARSDGAVDIVGHDWGAGHVYRLAATRPDLVRSWAADIGGLLHPDYEWHDAARAWQTPGLGEETIEAMVQLPVEHRAGLYLGLGLAAHMAQEMAEALDADMGRAILGLYRSSPEPVLRELADRLAAVDHGPGLVITATDDAYVPAALAGPVATRLGIDELLLEGHGHWWMVSGADVAAEGLVRFWSGLRSTL